MIKKIVATLTAFCFLLTCFPLGANAIEELNDDSSLEDEDTEVTSSPTPSLIKPTWTPTPSPDVEEPVLSETVSTKHKNYALVDPNPEDTVEEVLYSDPDVAAFKFKLYNGVIVEKEPRIIKIKTDSYHPTVNPDYDEYGTDGFNRQPSPTISATPEATPTKTATPTPSSTISATTEAPPMKIDDGNKKTDDFNASEGWFKKSIKKIKEWRWYLVFADLILGQMQPVKKLKAPRKESKKLYKGKPAYRKDLEYKRKVMKRMDRDNNKDDTGADYRGYRSGMQIVARFARKVSAFIEDNMFLMGMGVDGCGNMLTFLIEPNRRGIFTDENFNEDAIIWRIINNQRLDYLDRLNLENLIALNAALNRELVAAEGHLWICGQLSARIDEIEKKIIALGRAAATARRGMPLEQRLDDHVRHLGFERLRTLAAIPNFLHIFNADEMAVLRNRVNDLMTDRTIPIGQRLDLHADLLLGGLTNMTAPPNIEIIEAEEDEAARYAALEGERIEELLAGIKHTIGVLPIFLIGLPIFLLIKVLK